LVGPIQLVRLSETIFLLAAIDWKIVSGVGRRLQSKARNTCSEKFEKTSIDMGQHFDLVTCRPTTTDASCPSNPCAFLCLRHAFALLLALAKFSIDWSERT